jgi:hypothetical protein
MDGEQGPSFDLTTIEGAKAATLFCTEDMKIVFVNALAYKSHSSRIRNAPSLILSPLLRLVRGVFGLVDKHLSPEVGVEKQVAAVRDLIEAGRMNGVRSMTINVDQGVESNLALPIPGTQIDLGAGSRGSIQLKIVYK